MLVQINFKHGLHLVSKPGLPKIKRPDQEGLVVTISNMIMHDPIVSYCNKNQFQSTNLYTMSSCTCPTMSTMTNITNSCSATYKSKASISKPSSLLSLSSSPPPNHQLQLATHTNLDLVMPTAVPFPWLLYLIGFSSDGIFVFQTHNNQTEQIHCSARFGSGLD